MVVGEIAAGLRLALAGVGAAVSALNAVQIAVILPALIGTAYSIYSFLYSLKEFVIEFIATSPYTFFHENFNAIFQSDLFHLVSYSCSFKTLGMVFNFYFFAFMTFVILVGTSITLWAFTKFWPHVSSYIYALAKRVSGG